MNAPSKNCEKFQHSSRDFQDASSIIHDFSAKLSFRDTKDLHNSLLSAAQIEHTKVREKALRLLELEQTRYEKENLRIKAEAAEEHKRIEAEKAFEASRLRNAENYARQIARPTPVANIQSKNNINSFKSAPASTLANKQTLLPTSAAALPTTVSSNRPIITSTALQTAVPTPKTQKKIPSNTISTKIPFNQPISIKSLTPDIHQTPRSISSKTLLNNDIPQRPHASTLAPVKQPVLTKKPSSSNKTDKTEALNQQDSKIIPTSINLHRKASVTPNPLAAQRLSFRNQSLGLVNGDRYREIHAMMKRVRNRIESQVDQYGRSTLLRMNCNKSRREITKALGQLVVGGKNTAIVSFHTSFSPLLNHFRLKKSLSYFWTPFKIRLNLSMLAFLPLRVMKQLRSHLSTKAIKL